MENNNVQSLMDILTNQNIDGVLSGNWEQIKPVVEVIDEDDRMSGRDKGDIHVTLEDLSIKFIFDSSQRLIGISNWKQ